MTNTNDRKVEQLAHYLDIPVEQIVLEDEESNDKENRFFTPYGTYLVMDEDESYEAVTERVEDIVDDLGIYGTFTPEAIEWIEENAINQDLFEESFQEMYESYAYDISLEPDDEYESRLVRECIDNGCISKRDVRNGKYNGNQNLEELLVEALLNGIDNYAREYAFQLGEDNMKHFLKNNPNAVDMDTIIQYCIDEDGYGHNIASWDGETIELDDYYAYKITNTDERDI